MTTACQTSCLQGLISALIVRAGPSLVDLADGPHEGLLDRRKPKEDVRQVLTSGVRFITASKLALALIAGLVGLVVGGGLAVAAIHLTSSTTQQTASSSASADRGQAKGHGAAVTAAVAKCKAQLKPGQHGIGHCVSAVASSHGKAASAARSANAKNNSAEDSDETDTDSTP
jgi:hypothetical protein